MCSHCFIYVGWQLICVRLHMICGHSSVCVNSQFHLVGCSLFVVVVCMCVIIFQFVSVLCFSFQLLALTLSCCFMCYRSVYMFPAVLWFSVFIPCVLHVFIFPVFTVCFQLLVVFSSDVFSVFLLHVCVCASWLWYICVWCDQGPIHVYVWTCVLLCACVCSVGSGVLWVYMFLVYVVSCVWACMMM